MRSALPVLPGSAPRTNVAERAKELSRHFSELVEPEGTPPGWEPGHFVGLEHEYQLRVGTHRVDFRGLVDQLGLGQRFLDPADPNAYRMPSGVALTADEAEAEVALPPVRVNQGFATGLARAAERERLALVDRLPSGLVAHGYSTHLSVSVPAGSERPAAELYARTFAPALMLVMDRPDSPGLLVRPRPGRVELGGEYVEGVRLAAAAQFAVGGVRACLSRLDGTRNLGAPDLRLRIVPDDHRYGWFVARDAFGADLYREGRKTRLRLADGRFILAQAHLQSCWASARAALVDDSELRELELLDVLVHGATDLPTPTTESPAVRLPTTELGDARDATADAFGRLSQPCSRPGFDLAPVMITWDRLVFVAAPAERRRSAFASVPGPNAAHFASLLASGALDDTITDYLSLPVGGRRLDRSTRYCGSGLFDDLGPRAGLLASERGPMVRARMRAAAARLSSRHGRSSPTTAALGRSA